MVVSSNDVLNPFAHEFPSVSGWLGAGGRPGLSPGLADQLRQSQCEALLLYQEIYIRQAGIGVCLGLKRLKVAGLRLGILTGARLALAPRGEKPVAHGGRLQSGLTQQSSKCFVSKVVLATQAVVFGLAGRSVGHCACARNALADLVRRCLVAL